MTDEGLPKFRIDMTGRRYGKLTVLRYSCGRGSKVKWLCRCDCGTEKDFLGLVLRHKTNRFCELSCGCDRYYYNTHGQSATREYRLWAAMLTRATNPNTNTASDYFGRGITACNGMHQFETFIESIGPSPSNRHTVDRIDTNKGYWCGQCADCLEASRACNVRWATHAEQMRNTRRTRLYTHNGETLCLQDWADRCGLSRSAIAARVDAGWSIGDAISTPGDGTTRVAKYSSTTLPKDKLEELKRKLTSGDYSIRQLASEYQMAKCGVYYVRKILEDKHGLPPLAPERRKRVDA